VKYLLILFSTLAFSQSITFKDLEMIKFKKKEAIENFLRTKNYSFSTTINGNVQWKSNSNSDIISFNGKGVVAYITISESRYKTIVNEIVKLNYKSSGTTIKNGLEVESFTNGKNTIFKYYTRNPENNKMIYSISIV
jgi:hypothetical protein